MKYFFSCDWGTSAFRLRLIDAAGLGVAAEIKTNYGIAAAFDDWKKADLPEGKRLNFYKDYLSKQYKKLKIDFNTETGEAPVMLSGMASSSIGMMMLPYKELPFYCNGSDLLLHKEGADEFHPYELIIVSGASTETEVVRGEETMLAGCGIASQAEEQLLIFPGTHSKHLLVKNGQVINITTYMTGELFDLLANKSILSASVQKSADPAASYDEFFNKGLDKALKGRLANLLFQVRTNQLFKKATPEENYAFLSGLLIGHELKDIVEKRTAAIILVCGEGLKKAYQQALEKIGLAASVDYVNADEALVEGQWKIIEGLYTRD